MKVFFGRTTQVAIDLVVLAAALGLALFLRFDGEPPPLYARRLLILAPYVVALQYGALLALGVHRYQWRHVGLREVTRIFAAIALAGSLLLLVRIVAAQVTDEVHAVRHLVLPLGVTLIDIVIAFVGITGVRACRRLLAERTDERRRAAVAVRRENTILIGAGQAGLLVAKELAGRPDLGLRPIGFLDDDPKKQGTVLHGLRVLGKTSDLARVCQERGTRQALITIAVAGGPGKGIRKITELCREHGIAAKIVPGIYEIVGGAVNLSRIRDVEIEDLLGREPIRLDVDVVKSQLSGKTVLVTGAGGSIGSELCRQVARYRPARLILIEQAENALFDVHRELEVTVPEVPLLPMIADVCDAERIRWVFETHRPDVVFHAAAHKHVPMMELNPGEAIKNNFFGTKTLADQADRSGVGSFVMISTDKAVNPTSVMGTTKRAAEIYANVLGRRSSTRFVTVRFGNVLGSAGSVIPLFKEQIARGGPVKVTHPEMKRYFMTIPEACQLVMEAGAMGAGGEIFILDMGEPVRILDLARDMIKLSGFEPDEDIEIQFTGIRPGEKLFEELAVDGEGVGKTRHPKIFVGQSRQVAAATLERWIREVRAHLDGGTPAAIKAKLAELIPEFHYAVTPIRAPHPPLGPAPAATSTAVAAIPAGSGVSRSAQRLAALESQIEPS